MLDTSAAPARKSQLLIHPAAAVLLLKGRLFASFVHHVGSFLLVSFVLFLL